MKGYKYGPGGKIVKVASKASKKPVSSCSGAGYTLAKSNAKGLKSAAGRKLESCRSKTGSGFVNTPASALKIGKTYYHPTDKKPYKLKSKNGMVGTFYVIENGKMVPDIKNGRQALSMVDRKPLYKIAIIKINNSRMLSKK